MDYAKSVAVALLASTIAVSVAGLLVAVRAKRKFETSLLSGDAIFVRLHLHFWPVLCVAIAIFAFVFYWELQAASMPTSPH
jgi:hypothetical protein